VSPAPIHGLLVLRRRGRCVKIEPGMNIGSNSMVFCIGPVIMTNNTPWLLFNPPPLANITT
jgi:hypothetical protein